jgi:dienelactone hydrolase
MLAAAANSIGAEAAPRATLADGPVGRIEFNSYFPLGQYPFLSRTYLKDRPIVIDGALTLPGNSALSRDGKVPVVILMHGSGGISREREHAWAERFNAWGIGAFVLDSFAGRGIKPPNYADRNFVHGVAHVLDAYLSLRLLATHPRIDGARIAVMGFSKGGQASLDAIFEPFRIAALGPEPKHKFAAYVPFYPYCNFRHVSKALAAAPMLMLLAGRDEMTEPKPCQNAAAWLMDRNVPVKVVVYPSAHHAFDRPDGLKFDKNYVGIKSCEAEMDLDTRAIRRLDTGAPLATKAANDAWLAECRKRGAHFGGDAKSREAAIAEVRAFLGRVFKP